MRREAREDVLAEQQQHTWIQQQWWFKKLDAYNDVMDAVWQVLQRSRDWIDYMDNGEAQQPGKLRSAEYDEQRVVGTIDRLLDVGALYFSEGALVALSEFRKRQRQIDHDYHRGEIDSDQAAYGEMVASEQCLARLRDAAQVDLGIGFSEFHRPPLLKEKSNR